MGHHLHLEMKAAAVTSNPFGVGTQTTTCATDPLNAKANWCWGYVADAASPPEAPDDYGYLNPADYLNKTLTLPVYRQVSAGASHTCALKADNTLACWGGNDYGQATPPAGAFQQVSAGGYQSCGIRADGFMACWGSTNPVAPSGPRRGAALALVAGRDHPVRRFSWALSARRLLQAPGLAARGGWPRSPRSRPLRGPGPGCPGWSRVGPRVVAPMMVAVTKGRLLIQARAIWAGSSPWRRARAT